MQTIPLSYIKMTPLILYDMSCIIRLTFLFAKGSKLSPLNLPTHVKTSFLGDAIISRGKLQIIKSFY